MVVALLSLPLLFAPACLNILPFMDARCSMNEKGHHGGEIKGRKGGKVSFFSFHLPRVANFE